VQVCPTGIDIRDGLQYECIGCSACVDACDSVMEKMNYPLGLIRYTTEHALEGKLTRVLRPRVLIYGTILLGLFAALVYALAIRTPLALDVIRDRNRLYREVAAGVLENVYTLKIINMDEAPHEYALSVAGPGDFELLMDAAEIRADGGQLVDLPVRVRAQEDALQTSSTLISFSLTAEDEPELTVSKSAAFLGPLR
jgi:cytochrome c oxidase accessory protein FixG